MRRLMCASVVLVAIAANAAGCASTPRCAQRYIPQRPPQPFLWEVTGPRGGVVLLGTLHSAGKVDVPAQAWALLDGATVFVAEADEVGRNDGYGRTGNWESAFLLPRGESLMRSLDTDDFYDLQRRLELDAYDLARLKPWVALALLMKTRFAFPELNISAALLEQARAREIPTEFFDTWPEQVAFLDQTVDVADLRGGLHDYPNLGCKLIGQIEAYRAGDDDAFRVDTLAPTDPGPERVARWSARIAEYLGAGRRAFIAIGVGNILGARGIAADLQARGFVISRVPGACCGAAR